jgi:hypothetical protein
MQLNFSLPLTRRHTLLLCLVLFLLLGGALLTLSASSAVTLEGLSSGQLSSVGISLSRPNAANPRLTGLAARETAERSFPSMFAAASDTQVVLAVVTDSQQSPVMKRLCWVVVATYPDGMVVPGPIAADVHRITWFLVCVDAVSGQVALGEGGN